ncbi:uncharacterized protein N7496_001165 [Penicillium cataractarum]|uniref:Uncharacterized protein n=1 Tax=Penicillium cataractarum TaxID=2100454 RepID=A0A9X0B6U0_9EURO|nr:uncharacterized protein N7496_001165 [Penicillium cataractarum]KAJ5390097.1 hypothetical protein N7496_001165 [Penicillium cataractarum]
MSLLGKKFPGMLGVIVLYGVNSLQNVLSNTRLGRFWHRSRLFEFITILRYRPTARSLTSEWHRLTIESLAAEFKNDPRNPNAKAGNSH